MKKIAVGVVFAAAILTGSAAAQAHTVTVAEACGGCAMPDGLEQFSLWDAQVDIYFKTNDLPHPLVALIRRIVAHGPYGQIVIVDQIVTASFIPGHTGSGPVVKIVVWDGNEWNVRYEWRTQDIVEYVSLMQYGQRWRW